MKVWIEADSESFEIWKSEHPYGVETEVPSDLLEEYENVIKRAGEIRTELYRMMDDQA